MCVCAWIISPVFDAAVNRLRKRSRPRRIVTRSGGGGLRVCVCVSLFDKGLCCVRSGGAACARTRWDAAAILIHGFTDSAVVNAGRSRG